MVLVIFGIYDLRNNRSKIHKMLTQGLSKYITIILIRI